jgi:lipid II:glycine glycyltransferase (peptidoglycan interpeptide bridge formation enzyme)
MVISSNTIEVPAQFLFNQHEYLNYHSSSYITFLDRFASPAVICKFAEMEKGIYTSGIRAPFGGIECISSADLDFFVKDILKEFSCRKASFIIIRQSPACYQPDYAESINNALVDNGFTLTCSDVNQHILVDSSSIFAANIDDQKRRRLQKLKSHDVKVEFYDHIESADWYKLYVKSRQLKDFPVTISKEAYLDLSHQLTDVYTYAGVYIEGRLIANAVFVKVNADVLYYFLAASDPDYASLSPSVLLVEAMYELAQQHNYKMIDLGISSVDGIVNNGLHLFKKHLGGIDSQKNTYAYSFK